MCVVACVQTVCINHLVVSVFFVFFHLKPTLNHSVRSANSHPVWLNALHYVSNWLINETEKASECFWSVWEPLNRDPQPQIKVIKRWRSHSNLSIGCEWKSITCYIHLRTRSVIYTLLSDLVVDLFDQIHKPEHSRWSFATTQEEFSKNNIENLRLWSE